MQNLRPVLTNRATLCAALISISLLCACASTDGEPKPRGIELLEGDIRLGEKTDSVCFTRNIDSFSNNKRDTVVISAGGNKDYLIETFGICHTLRNAGSISLDNTGSCLRAGDSIIVSESAFSISDSGGIGPERCSVKSIYKWDKRAGKE